MRGMVILAVLAAVAFPATIGLAEDKEEKPKHSIKDVMKIAHKDGLLKTVLAGDASEEDKKKLVELYTALAANKPPKGEPAAWKERTAAIVKAAKAVAEGGDTADLKAATNCGACHSKHKG